MRFKSIHLVALLVLAHFATGGCATSRNSYTPVPQTSQFSIDEQNEVTDEAAARELEKRWRERRKAEQAEHPAVETAEVPQSEMEQQQGASQTRFDEPAVAKQMHIPWTVPDDATLFGLYVAGDYDSLMSADEFFALVERPGKGVVGDPGVIYARETLLIPEPPHPIVLSIEERAEAKTQTVEEVEIPAGDSSQRADEPGHFYGEDEMEVSTRTIEGDTRAEETDTDDGGTDWTESDMAMVDLRKGKYFWWATSVLLTLLSVLLAMLLVWMWFRERRLRNETEILRGELATRDRELTELEWAFGEVGVEFTLIPDFFDAREGSSRRAVRLPTLEERVIMPCSIVTDQLVLVAARTRHAGRGVKGHLRKCATCREILGIEKTTPHSPWQEDDDVPSPGGGNSEVQQPPVYHH